MDRLVGVDSLFEVVTLKKLLDREVRRQFDHFVERLTLQPFTVVTKHHAATIQDLERLIHVRRTICLYGLLV